MNNLLDEVIEHLLKDAKPSIYLKSARNDFKNTPLDILNSLETVEQEKKYHPEGNVWNHVMLVVDTAASIREYANSPKTFMLAALFHDIGKKAATRKNRSGRWISYDHDKIGANLLKEVLEFYSLKEDEIDKVCSLVRYHMHHLFIIKNLPYGNVEGMIKEVDLNDMILLFISDRLGRLQETYEEKSKEINDVLEILEILNNKYGVNVTNIKDNVQHILNNYKKIKKI